MNIKEKNVPEIRFKEFINDGPWDKYKLGDIGDTYTGLSGKTKDDFDKGEAKFITYMNVFSNPITKKDYNGLGLISIDNKQNQVKYGDVFFTTSSETPEEVGMSSVWTYSEDNIYLNSFCFGYRPKITLNPYFTAFMLRSSNVRKKFMFLAQGISRYNISKTKAMNIKINIPDLKEQQKIGSFFQAIDNLISFNQEKLDEIKLLKKAYLSEMFPAKNKLIPKRRFKGFNECWKQYELGELIDQIIREVPKPEKPYYRMSVRSHAKGTFKQLVDDPKKISMDKLFVVKKDDLVVNITFAWEHAIAVVPSINDGLLVSHRFPTYRANDKSCINFLEYLVYKENFRRNLELISPGGAGRNRVLNKKDFMKLKVVVPNVKEQQKIGSFFKSLDHLITLHQDKLNKLQDLKKAYLNKMFV